MEKIQDKKYQTRGTSLINKPQTVEKKKKTQSIIFPQ